MGSEEGGSNESNQASSAQQDNAGPEGEQGSIERTPDVGGISGSSQDVRINNGDIVFYQGNQYEVNGITTDGQFVDLELDGKPAFEDIPVSEVSKTLSQQIESQQPELNPSEAQKEAGNYKKAHINVQGFDITIENPKGSIRSGIDENGREWSNTLQNHYGYFKRTEGKDGDQIDVFIGENPESGTVFVVDQNNPESGAFDESKVMLGFNTPEEAKAAYMSNYEDDWKGFGAITPVSVEDFKKWLYDGAKQRKPFSEYKDTPDAVEVEESGQSLAEESEAVKELRKEIKDLKSQKAKLIKEMSDRNGLFGDTKSDPNDLFGGGEVDSNAFVSRLDEINNRIKTVNDKIKKQIKAEATGKAEAKQQQSIDLEEKSSPIQPEGLRKQFKNEFGSFTSVFVYVNPNNAKEFMVQTTVRKANEDGTISMQKHEKWMPIEKYDEFTSDLNKRAESLPKRFESGKKLTEEEKREVLKSMKDSYKEKNRPRTLEAGPNGVERFMWLENSSDYMEKSDITGRSIRWYITMPDGKIAHPTELYPDLTPEEMKRIEDTDERFAQQAESSYKKGREKLEPQKKEIIEALDNAIQAGVKFERTYDGGDIRERNPNVTLRRSSFVEGDPTRGAITVKDYMKIQDINIPELHTFDWERYYNESKSLPKRETSEQKKSEKLSETESDNAVSQEDKKSENDKSLQKGKLGTGAGVYFDKNGLRVNENSKGGYLLNITARGEAIPMANIQFDSSAEAIAIAERLNSTYPNGVPGALLVEKVVEGWRNENVENISNPPQQNQPEKSSNYGENNKIVSKDRFEELKRKMRGKLGNLNAGFDPEILSIGTEMAVYHIEAGVRKFSDFARLMIKDLGDKIRPFLKSMYEGARYFPGMDEVANEMDDSRFVKDFDINSFKIEEERVVRTLKDYPLSSKLITDWQKPVVKDAWEEYESVIEELEKKLASIPDSPQDKGMKSIVYAHYFTGNTDIYILDVDGDYAYTYTILNGDAQMSEGGDTYIPELTRTKGMELDFHWIPKPLDEVLYNAYPEYFDKPENLTQNNSDIQNNDVSLSSNNQQDINENGKQGKDSRGDNKESESDRKGLSSPDNMEGQGASSKNAPRNSKGKRLRTQDSSSKPGDGPRYDVDKTYTNEEIGEIISSVTDIEDDKVVITGEVTEDIKTIAGRYISGGVAKQGRGVLDEYYTDAKIVDAVSRIISGYIPSKKPIKALEPSVGTGNFIQALPKRAEINSFEINETTARIAKIFNPTIEVNLRSFETEFIDDSGKKKPITKKYNIVIGNPPYGEHRGKYKGLGEESNISRYEDYFVKRSLDVLEEGGILAMVLPSSWMDRHKLESGYTIEVAYRLPSGAFEATQVGTDIVVLKKKADHISTAPHNYFENNPENILGEIKERTNRFGRTEQYVSGDIDSAIKAIEKSIAQKIANQLQLDFDQDDLNDIAESIEEVGSVKKAKKVIKASKGGGRGVIFGKKEEAKKQIKHELSKKDEVVPASLQFQNEFTKEEEAAFKDSDYAGVISNYEKHRKFVNYHNGKWVHDFYYAEGNIYEKLEQLERDRNNMDQSQYDKQKELLKSVLPEIKPLDRISISPNTEFVKNLTISTDRSNAGYMSLKDLFVSFVSSLPRDSFGDSNRWEVVDFVNNRQVYGTDKERNALIRERRKEAANDLFKKFLNDEITDREKSQIEYAFNREYNSTYRPDYAKVPMFSNINRTFKGEPLKLTVVQKAGIGRLTVKGVGVLAHEVGFGKTLSGILSIHEAMTRGMAKKPIIVVPNDSILKQWVETIYEVLPKSKVNVLGNLGVDYDLTNFTINDGEITLVTYEGFKAMGYSDETYNTLSADFNYITDDLRAHRSERDKQKDKAKQEETEGRMRKKASYNFEDFGFDFLTFDEVHNANHIVGKVKLDKKDASDFRSQSQRTSDLGIKTWLASQYIQKNNNGRNVLLLSATPFTNKPLEYYSILSLVANSTLRRMGFYRIEQFFETFMEADNDIEIKADGSPTQKTNVRRFKNNGLFNQLLSEFIDIKGEDDNPDLVRPERRNHEYKIPQNDLTVETISNIQDLFMDNEEVLKGITHSRLAAFSPYASHYCPEQPKSYVEFVENSPKIHTAIKLIAQNKKDNSEAGQLIYSEIGVEFFPMIQEYLVEKVGYRHEEVSIISGATSIKERVHIQNQFNKGSIKVIIGSPAIKEGINLQENTTDMYILSLPYNFTQLRQVEGRSWRQGNKWSNIRVNYMLTNNSVDVFMLQRLQIKQGLYNESMKNGADTVDVSDIDTSELKTALITNPETRANIELMIEERRLESAKTRITSDLAFVHRKYEKYNELKTKLKNETDSLEQKKEWAKTDPWWSKNIEYDRRKLESTKNLLEAEKQHLAEKGVNVDDIVNQEARANNQILEIDKKIKGLKERFWELVAQYTEENIKKSRKEGDVVEKYLKERAQENKGKFYTKRDTNPELLREPELQYGKKLPSTININGVEKPTTNSEGKPIHSTEEGVRNFYEWFGDSRVVDNEGRPLVVYHGTDKKFNTFDKSKKGITRVLFSEIETQRHAFFFTPSEKIAIEFGFNLIPAYLKSESIVDMDDQSIDNKLIENGVEKKYLSPEFGQTWELFDNEFGENIVPALKKMGYDGITFQETGIENEEASQVYGVFSPNQIKSATSNTGEFSPEDASILHEPGLQYKVSETGFYSTVEKALSAISQEKGTRDQFKAMLLKNGAKQAELDWMGFDELPEKLTKVDIQNWIDENRIEVEEVHLTLEKNEDKRYQEELEERVDEMVADDVMDIEIDTDIETREYFEITEPIFLEDGYYLGDSDSNTMNKIAKNKGYEDYTALFDAMDSHFVRLKEEKINSQRNVYLSKYKAEYREGEKQYEGYSLPGGKNYRELLLTLPKIEGALKFKQFHSSKFYAESPILAHVRFNEREVNGERVLFIEEIQSDWAQTGKKEGFKGDVKGNYEDYRDELYKKYEVNTLEELVKKTTLEEKDRLTLLFDNNEAIKPPPMPFKKTDQWVNLALRRIMRYAAENGFDRIAWTNGEQQAERYDLSKQADRIEVIPVERVSNTPYEYVVQVYKDGQRLQGKNAKTIKEVEEFVGKDIAEKVANGGYEVQNFTGSDLRVGGFGMKAFYDNIIPAQASKLGKPFGAKTEAIEMETGIQMSLPITESMRKTAMEGMPLFEPQQQFINFTPEEIQDETNKAHGSEEKRQEGINKTVEAALQTEISGDRREGFDTGWGTTPIRQVRTVLEGFKESGYVDFIETEVETF